MNTGEITRCLTVCGMELLVIRGPIAPLSVSSLKETIWSGLFHEAFGGYVIYRVCVSVETMSYKVK